MACPAQHCRTAGADEEAAASADKQRAHLTGALTALRNVVEAHPKLSALLAARPALAPLLNCLDPICRCAWPAIQVVDVALAVGIQICVLSCIHLLGAAGRFQGGLDVRRCSVYVH